MFAFRHRGAVFPISNLKSERCRASLACEVKMLSAQTPHFDREALMRRLRERAAREGYGEAREERATLTGPLQDDATLTGPLQDGATLTGPLQDDATLTEPLQDSATLTGPLRDGAARAAPGEEDKPATVLTDEIKAFIVRGLARYETPTRVAAAVKSVFGVEVSRQHVHIYNARGAQPPAERWCELFEQTRESFLTDLAAIGVAQKAVRLHRLERFAQLAEESGCYTKAAAFLEQAAKECGGVFEGRKRAT
jgi:hypothetical protein